MEDIAEYLRNVTGGRPLPEPVVREVEQRYRLIGRSPLTEITLRQAEGVSRETGLPVYVGMRNWRPYIGDTVRKWPRTALPTPSLSAWRRTIPAPAWGFTRGLRATALPASVRDDRQSSHSRLISSRAGTIIRC